MSKGVRLSLGFLIAINQETREKQRLGLGRVDYDDSIKSNDTLLGNYWFYC